MSKKTNVIPGSFGQGVDIVEASNITGLSVQTIYIRVNRRTIPFHKASGRLLFSPRELREWFEQQPRVNVRQALANQRKQA